MICAGTGVNLPSFHGENTSVIKPIWFQQILPKVRLGTLVYRFDIRSKSSTLGALFSPNVYLNTLLNPSQCDQG